MPLVLAPAAAAGSPARPPGFGAVPPAVAVPGDGLDGPPVPSCFGVVPGGSTEGSPIDPPPGEFEPAGRLRSGILMLGGVVDEFGGNWMVLGLPASCGTGTLTLGTFGTLTFGSFGRLGLLTFGS